MTLRIALIGNSHAAAWKAGWDAVAQDWPDAEITFFAARSRRAVDISRLRPEGGKLVADQPRLAEALAVTSGGQRTVDPADYDALILTGFLPRIIALPPVSPYSAAVRAAMYDSAKKGTPLARMVHRIRQAAPQIPVFAAAYPLEATGPDNAPAESARYHAAAAEMAARVHTPMGATLLPQPAPTILADRWTSPAYSRGSVRLADRPDGAQKAHPGDDRQHMNAEFGKLALAEALGAIRSALA